jgi:hypothetical protein
VHPILLLRHGRRCHATLRQLHREAESTPDTLRLLCLPAAAAAAAAVATQLGLLASSLVAGDPFKAGPWLPMSVTNAVDAFISGLHKAGFSNHPSVEGSPLEGLRHQLLQQLTDSGFHAAAHGGHS